MHSLGNLIKDFKEAIAQGDFGLNHGKAGVRLVYMLTESGELLPIEELGG